MRDVQWKTTRWRLPSSLRREILLSLMAKKVNGETLGKEFVGGLEKRRDMLESRQWKATALQVPLFAMLVFSLVNVDLKVTFLGFSAESLKSLREVIVVLSSTIAIVTLPVNLHLYHVQEMMKAAVEKLAAGDRALKEVLEVRYGISASIVATTNADGTLVGFGAYQILTGIVVVMTFAALIIAAIAAILSVQAWTLYELYHHPNFSVFISKCVIAFVGLADLFLVGVTMLIKGFQPYQTWEDFKRLNKFRETDHARYQQVINDIVGTHRKRNWIARAFLRPRMKRLP